MAQAKLEQSEERNAVNALFGNNEKLANYLMPDDPSNANSIAVWQQLKPHLPEILKKFYNRLGQVPMMVEKLGNDPATPERLSGMQIKHWERVFTGDIDRDLEHQARLIGSAHVRIGLTSDWFIAGYGRILMDAIPAILKAHRFTPQRASLALQTLVSRVFMDMALANESYSNQVTDVEAHEWREDNDYQNLRTISEAMTSLNEVTLNLALLTDSTRRSNSSTESVAAAVEELVASISQLSETSQNTADDAMETNTALENGVKGVAQARTAIVSVAGAAERSSESIQSLQQAAAEISDFMGVIQSISDQTNLLALNATIEAARAGDAGRGFAVVASEVKELANQAAKATEDVATRIQTLQQGIDLINQTFAETRAAIETGEATLDEANSNISGAGAQMNTVAQRMSEVANILEQQNFSASEIGQHVTSISEGTNKNAQTLFNVAEMLQASNDTLSGTAQKWFRNSSARSLCEMAKIDHILFKKRVVDTILGRGHWQSDELPDHHSCRLGKWYDAIKDSELQNTPFFKNLKDPHRRVHDSAKIALKAHESKDLDAALRGLQDLEQSSREVLEILNKVSNWLHERESISERRKRDRQPVFGEKVTLSNEGSVLQADVLDEAVRGIGVDGIGVDKIGQKFTIDYKGPKTGTVRWSNGKRGGVEFD